MSGHTTLRHSQSLIKPLTILLPLTTTIPPLSRLTIPVRLTVKDHSLTSMFPPLSWTTTMPHCQGLLYFTPVPGNTTVPIVWDYSTPIHPPSTARNYYRNYTPLSGTTILLPLSGTTILHPIVRDYYTPPNVRDYYTPPIVRDYYTLPHARCQGRTKAALCAGKVSVLTRDEVVLADGQPAQ